MRPHPTAWEQSTYDAPPPDANAADGPLRPLLLMLVAVRDAPASARAELTAWMAGHVSETLLADAQVLIGALLTDSVRRADGLVDAVIRVRGQVGPDVLRLEVVTHGRANGSARVPDPQHGGALRLHLADSVPGRWGVERDGAGTRVWAELALRASPDTPWPTRDQACAPTSTSAPRCA